MNRPFSRLHGASVPSFITLCYLINDKFYRLTIKLRRAVNARGPTTDNLSIEFSFVMRLNCRDA